MTTVVQKRLRFYTVRKVKFDLNLSIIFIEDDEDRKGPWELLTIDRYRFNRRIKNIEKEIEWCFKPEHRNSVLNKFYKVD
jgi:hypothetical protein